MIVIVLWLFPEGPINAKFIYTCQEIYCMRLCHICLSCQIDGLHNRHKLQRKLTCVVDMAVEENMSFLHTHATINFYCNNLRSL